MTYDVRDASTKLNPVHSMQFLFVCCKIMLRIIEGKRKRQFASYKSWMIVCFKKSRLSVSVYEINIPLGLVIIRNCLFPYLVYCLEKYIDYFLGYRFTPSINYISSYLSFYVCDEFDIKIPLENIFMRELKCSMQKRVM